MAKNTAKESIPTKKRIDFASGVPMALFKRVNGRCSVPRCNKPTMGPFDDTDDAVNMGMACHIYSAAEDGPRGRGGKDDAFISSAENGIWCCHYHGTLIDKGKGKDYSAETLFSWKKLAEARARKQMNDEPSPLGWVDTIEFTEFAGCDRLPSLTLSRFTLLAGGSEAGKSVLLEAAASISNSKFGDRFIGTKTQAQDGPLKSDVFRAELVYTTVDYADKKIVVEIRDDILTRTDGGLPCLLPPGDIEIVLVSHQLLRRAEGEDDVDFFQRVLNLDRTAFFALARIGVKSVMPGEITFREAQDIDDDGSSSPRVKENGEPYLQLLIKRDRPGGALPFSSLSGSEQTRLIIDMYISKAREVCKQRLTLLLIDDFVASLDESNYTNLLTKLSQEDFQSVVVLPSARERNLANKTADGLVVKERDCLSAWRISTVDAYPFRSARSSR